jgi:hypothetical protein
MPSTIKLGALSCVFAAYLVGCVGEVSGYEEEPTGEDPVEEPTEDPTTPEDEQPPTTFAAAGWQLTAADVGLAKAGKSCASLPAYTGTMDPTDTTITGVRITGTLHPHGAVTLQGVCLEGEIFQGNITILDSEIVGPVATSSRGFDGGLITIKNSYVRNVSVGMWFENSVANKQVVIEGNVINSTSIGIETQYFYGTGSTAVIRGNRIIGASQQSAVVYLGAHSGAINNITFERNLIEGPNELIELNGSSPMSGIVVTDNRFTGGVNVNNHPTATFATWTGNYMYSASGTDGQGVTVASP